MSRISTRRYHVRKAARHAQQDHLEVQLGQQERPHAEAGGHRGRKLPRRPPHPPHEELRDLQLPDGHVLRQARLVVKIYFFEREGPIGRKHLEI